MLNGIHRIFYIRSCHLQTENVLLQFRCFYFIFLLLYLPSASTILLNRIWRIICTLFLILGEKHLSLQLFRIMLAVIFKKICGFLFCCVFFYLFWQMLFIRLRNFPTIPRFFMFFFNHNESFIFFKSFLSAYWDDHIAFVCYSFYVAYYINCYQISN